MGAFAAIDLGASSGRVMLGRVEEGRIELTEIARFVNTPVQLGDGLFWSVTELYRGIVDGLRALVLALNGEPLVSIGVDTWAVDYALIGPDGSMLGVPYHYRDSRTDGVADTVRDIASDQDLFARNGIARLPFNTAYQLLAESRSGAGRLTAADTILMIPDLVAFWLTGVMRSEVTNASTTGLLNPRTREWDDELIAELGFDSDLFAPLCNPGESIGSVTSNVAERIGTGTSVVAVGTHDTASAVAAVPAADVNFAYIVSGTWSLVGVETSAPILTDDARLAGFTNEAGIDGSVRLLHNVMGLWLLQESLRQWDRDGLDVVLEEVLHEAAALADLGAVVDPDLPVFLPPGDMPARIAAQCRTAGCFVPSTPAQTVRCIMDSLAAAYARTVRDAAQLSGTTIDVVHIVGGGSQNILLCQLTADALDIPVIAGPVEGSALGNVLVQARAAGLVDAELADIRKVVRESYPLTRYVPSNVSCSRA